MSPLLSRINTNVKSIQKSVIREISEMTKHIDGAVDLTIGQPDFYTPVAIKEAGKQAIDHNKTTYTQNAGLPELRAAVAGYVNRKYASRFAAGEIIVTNGAMEALDVVFRTLLEPGDEVIIFAPNYIGYEPLITLCGAKIRYIDLAETDYRITLPVLQAAINNHTKCILFNHPSNPTGHLFSEADLEVILQAAREHHLYVISDEIYSELVYDHPFTSLSSYLADKERVILINGLSKSHAMTGWRIGYLAAAPELVREMIKVHQFCATCASSISQHAAIAAFSGEYEEIAAMRTEYQKRRDFIYSQLVEMGLTVKKPSGAFYIFPRIPDHFASSYDFCMDLLRQQGVAVVPGSAFSGYGEGYFRISYAASLSRLQEGMARLQRFLAND